MEREKTILDERYEYFQNHRESIVGDENWTINAEKLIMDAYLVDINPSWVRERLRDNRGVDVYIRIIQKCRQMLLTIADNNNKRDIPLAEELNRLSLHYRKELWNHLSALAREYCLE